MKRTWKQIIALIIYYLLIFMGAYCFFLQFKDGDIIQNIVGAFLLTLLINCIKQYADGKLNN